MRVLILALAILLSACLPSPSTPTPPLPPRPTPPVPESVVKSLPTPQSGDVGTPAAPGGYPAPVLDGTVTPRPVATPPSYTAPGK